MAQKGGSWHEKHLKVLSYEDQGFMKIRLPRRDPQMQSKAVIESACALQYFNSTLCSFRNVLILMITSQPTKLVDCKTT